MTDGACTTSFDGGVTPFELGLTGTLVPPEGDVTTGDHVLINVKPEGDADTTAVKWREVMLEFDSLPADAGNYINLKLAVF